MNANRQSKGAMQQLELDLNETRAPKAYVDGFSTGENWDANWYPGGPWVCRDYDGSSAKIPPNEYGSKTYFDVWHIGFKRGLEARRKNCPEFAQWFDTNRQGLKRYRPAVA